MTGIDLNVDRSYSYLLISIGIIANESVMFSWRWRRNRKLEKIDDIEERAAHMNNN